MADKIGRLTGKPIAELLAPRTPEGPTDPVEAYCELMDESHDLLRAGHRDRAQHAYDIARQYAGGHETEYRKQWKARSAAKLRGAGREKPASRWITVRGKKVPLRGKA